MKRAPRVHSSVTTRIIEHLSLAVLLFNKDLYLGYLNPAAEMLFGVSAHHVIGKAAKCLLISPNEVLEMKLKQAVTSGQAFSERELSLYTHDGREIMVNCSADLIHSAPKKEELLVEIHCVDHYLRISREEQILSQHHATQALLKRLAHEINNPLGGLRGAAQLLERELPDPVLCEYTRVIIEEADRLQALLTRMLGPHRPSQRRDINVHQILERVRQLVLAEFTGLDIRRDYDPSIPPLLGDADQLLQALLNIARNGARAAGSRGKLILRTRVLRQFTLGHVRYRLVLQVDIEDNGPGIPRDMRERIFLPMVSGTEGGTGLGLTIAQTLINQHGGLIECTGKPGEMIFSVYIPLEPGHEYSVHSLGN